MHFSCSTSLFTGWVSACCLVQSYIMSHHQRGVNIRWKTTFTSSLSSFRIHVSWMNVLIVLYVSYNTICVTCVTYFILMCMTWFRCQVSEGLAVTWHFSKRPLPRPLQPINKPGHFSNPKTDILNNTPWDFPVSSLLWLIIWRCWEICGNKTSYYEAKHDLFLTLAKCFVFFKPKPNPDLKHSRW